MSNELFKEVWIIAFIIVLLLIILPLLVGVGFALLFGLIGFDYLLCVFGTAFIIWCILGLIWWS